MRLTLGFLFIAGLLTGCMVGPNYKEPLKKVASHWKKDNTVRETPIQDQEWWKVFHDDNLTALIQEGYHSNISIQVAGVHVLQARAQLAQSVGGLYPQQQAMTGNLTYQRIGGSSLQDLLPSNFYTDAFGWTASWEIDFWGKYRRAILSNDANFLASYAAYDNALVSLTADIATTYIGIRTTQRLINVTKANIKVQQMAFDIAKARYTAGQVSLLDVEQSQTILSQTEATLPNYVAQLQKQKDALGVLLGTTPDCVDNLLAKNKGIPKSPTHVAVGIPKETIIKRPDIYQSRMEAVVQSELIGAQKANLFPSFSLTGTFLFSSNTINGNSLGNLFQWGNQNITAGPSFTWPLLNYGQITNVVRQQDAVFQQAILNYVNAVLKAQQEVQDNITSFIESKKSTRFLTSATHSALKSMKLAIVRYREGESDYTPVLDAERQLLNVQIQLTNAQGSIPTSLVALYRALGGGWQIKKCNDIVANEIKQEMAKRTNWGNLLKQPNHEPPHTHAQQMKTIFLPSW